MKFLSRMLAMASILSAFGASTAYAQGSVSGVNVTTSVNTLNITVTAPNTTQATFGAGATTGVPLPDKEWSVTAGPFYSWSASPGIAKPSDTAETTVSAPFTQPGSGVVYASCSVSYTVTRDDGATSTISGSGSASVQVKVGVVWDTGFSIGQYFGTDAQNNSVILHNGRMTAPQDQTKSPATPSVVAVLPGKTLPCSVESATDLDHKSYPANDSSHQAYVPDTVSSYTWSCTGGQFLTGTNPDSSPIYASTATGTSATWVAPSSSQYCTISCTIKDLPTPVILPDTGPRGPESTTVGCSVAVLSAGLAVRRVGALKPDPADQTHVKTLPADFAPSVKVAAGAQTSIEHQADVQVAIKLPDGTPAVGIKVSFTGMIVSGGQGPNDPPNNVTATIKLGDGITDANGLVTYPAAFTSGNRTETTVIRANYGNGSGPTASLNQVWNEDGSPWGYDTYFDYDVPSPVSYRMDFNDEYSYTVPITKHHMNFVSTVISGYEWSAAAGDYEPISYSGAAITVNGYDGVVSWGSVSESGGVYTAMQTVSSDYNSSVKTYTVHNGDGTTSIYPVDFIDDGVSFDINDNDTYNAN